MNINISKEKGDDCRLDTVLHNVLKCVFVLVQQSINQYCRKPADERRVPSSPATVQCSLSSVVAVACSRQCLVNAVQKVINER